MRAPSGAGEATGAARETAEPRSSSGWWSGPEESLQAAPHAFADALARLDAPLFVVDGDDGPAVAQTGTAVLHGTGTEPGARSLVAFAAPARPEDLGDASFRADHGLRYAYVAGAMANGIGSEEIVEAMGRSGMLGFFGAAGLDTRRVEAAIDRIAHNLGERPYGFNLIHSPGEPGLEAAVADLYVRRRIRLVSASAYLRLTLPLVRYRTHGIHRAPDGAIVTPNRVIAKVSRVEVATRFLSPPPAEMLARLVEQGDLTPEQAELAAQVPVAQDLTAEADSGGHTDNRAALALVPTLIALADRIRAERGYPFRLRVGAAGGIATPAAAAAAFAMGAAFVLTGSVNQSCVEAGTSDAVREMLAAAGQADVCMAPAADMFEMGVKVQVLKRGTMFAMRGAKLFELYRERAGLHELSDAEREHLERTILCTDLTDVWEQTKTYFARHDPGQIERAERDPKHKMALVFRWYLGQTSNWAKAGEASRRIDYQIWCGPAMGAFNEWARGSALEDWRSRGVVAVARNLLHGATVLGRAAVLRGQGVDVPPASCAVRPLPANQLSELFG